MKKVVADGYEFSFTDAVDAFVFDEKDSSKATYHGAPMKGVDVLVELDEAYLYIEIKDYVDSSICDVKAAINPDDKKEKQTHYKWLKSYLKYKYRDTYLYRYAEDKVEKPIHYICLLSFDNALNNRMKKDLKRELPIGKPSPRWTKSIAKSCQVLNITAWNNNFPQWPVIRISSEATA